MQVKKMWEVRKPLRGEHIPLRDRFARPSPGLKTASFLLNKHIEECVWARDGSKHDKSTQCLTNGGPPSMTLAYHWSNIG